MTRVSLFHVGPQKSGRTWVYHCLREHPQIAAPASDLVYYFDMQYHRGHQWYEAQFPTDVVAETVKYDPTPSYFRSPLAPRRIRAYNPEARIAVTLRNPIERAFSHYWHEKKKGVIRYSFREALENYDLFSSWIETGFYAEHIERYLHEFPREQLLLQRFEKIADAPAEFIAELQRFAGVDADFRPSLLHEPTNQAGWKQSWWRRCVWESRVIARRVGFNALAEYIDGAGWLTGTTEYEQGIGPDLFETLVEVFEPEIRRLESLLDEDFSNWRKPPES